MVDLKLLARIERNADEFLKNSYSNVVMFLKQWRAETEENISEVEKGKDDPIIATYIKGQKALLNRVKALLKKAEEVK